MHNSKHFYAIKRIFTSVALIGSKNQCNEHPCNKISMLMLLENPFTMMIIDSKNSIESVSLKHWSNLESISARPWSESNILTSVLLTLTEEQDCGSFLMETNCMKVQVIVSTGIFGDTSYSASLRGLMRDNTRPSRLRKEKSPPPKKVSKK